MQTLAKMKQGVRLSAMSMIVLATSSIRVFKNANIRAVDAFVLVVLGIAIGVFIMNLAMYLRMKKQTNNNAQ